MRAFVVQKCRSNNLRLNCQEFLEHGKSFPLAIKNRIGYDKHVCLLVHGINVRTPNQNVINLAKGLNLNIKKPAIWTTLQTDCCTAVGITCVSQLVTEIDWHTMGLDGNKWHCYSFYNHFVAFAPKHPLWNYPCKSPKHSK